MSPAGFRVLWPDVGLEGTMKVMAGRKRHSAEDIVRKLRRADELAAEGKTGQEIAAELGVSAATLSTGAAPMAAWTPTPPRNPKSCASRTPASSDCWPRPNWKKTPCARWPRENSEPGRQARHAVDMLKEVRGVSERLA